MTTGNATSNGVSAPPIDASVSENGRLRELDDALCAVVIAMDLRQQLQVIVSAHDVLARRLRGGTVRTQLTLIEGAAARLAAAVDRLVEILRPQGAVDAACHSGPG